MSEKNHSGNDPKREELIYRTQSELIGKRFAGASLASVTFTSQREREVIGWLEKKRNFLILLGNSGIGKTYFCSAVIHWIYGKVSSYRYWKESNLFQEVRSVISSGSGDYIRKLDSLTDDEFVMIDDMGSSGVNEWRKEVLLHLIDGRYESLKPTIFTSNLTRQEIFRDLGSRSESRLFSKENLVLEIHNGEDIRQRETK